MKGILRLRKFLFVSPIWILSIVSFAYGEAGEGLILYVSPDGEDAGAGTREQPLGTVAAAVEKITNVGGRIVLLEGTYYETVLIPAAQPDQPVPELVIEAEEPGSVVFIGGQPVESWQSWEDKPGLFLIALDNAGAGGLGVWEEQNRIRYREAADPAGVEAHPGSFMIVEGRGILIHTREANHPEEAGLWYSLGSGYAFSIERENTALHGIRFHHYLGARMSGPVHVRADRVTVSNLTVLNATTGILVRSEVHGTIIEDCILQDVGTGIYNLGNESQIRNCLIEAGKGAFAIEIQQHMRNGIRWYYPARGGVVEQCVTRGFWTGLYIKTISADLERGARPVLIQHNTFLDGVRAGSGAGGTAPQPLNHYLYNIIGPNEDQLDMEAVLPAIQATIEGNYFYDREHPFVDLSAGDLRIREEISFDGDRAKGADRKEVRWRAARAEILAETDQDSAVLDFVRPPVYASSLHGARVTVYLNRKAPVILRYRRSGTQSWTEVSGRNQSLSEWRGGIVVPRWEKEVNPYRVGFALSDKQLQRNTTYEFQLEYREGGERMVTEIHRMRTSGGSKQIHVQSGAVSENADGSSHHPFANLQEALDHAFPGDTVLVRRGVYTQPAILEQGGTPDEPIVIQGEGESLSILDGAKLYPVMLEFTGAQNVIIRDLQIRWFGRYGIYAKNSKALTVEGCRFRNATVARRMSPNGMGIRLEDTPDCQISECVFTTNEYGVDAIRSPGLIMRGNTAFLNLYSGVRLISSSRNSVLMYNSFTFTGNDALSIQEPDPQAFASLQSDYNNLGTVLRQDTAPLRPENDFSAPSRYAGTGMLFSKGILRAQVGEDPKWHRFTRIQDWRQFSDKDHHSIFEDPDYAAPLEGNFQIHTGSPNLLPDGKLIGVKRALQK